MSGVTDSGRQLYSGGNYSPSSRASKGASSAQASGAGSKPVVCDGPSSSGGETRGGSDGTKTTNPAGTNESNKNNGFDSYNEPTGKKVADL